jgi:hypothetical protein
MGHSGGGFPGRRLSGGVWRQRRQYGADTGYDFWGDSIFGLRNPSIFEQREFHAGLR